MIRTSIIALSASALLATVASAAEKAVSFDREALSDPAAVAALYSDLEKAAVQTCREEMWSSPIVRRKLRACVAESLAKAVASVDSPELTAYAAAQADSDERLASN